MINSKIDVEKYEKFLNHNEFITHVRLVRDYQIRIPHESQNTLYIKDEKLFDRYKNGTLRNVKTQIGEVSISEELAKDFISNHGLFLYLLSNLYNNTAIAIDIRLFKNNEIDKTSYIRLRRIDILTMYEQMDKSLLDPKSQMRIAFLLASSQKETLTKKYSEMEMEEIIDGDTYKFTGKEIIDLLFLSEENYKELITNDKNKEIKVLFLMDFIERNRILEKYILPNEIVERIRRLKKYEDIDYESLNECLAPNDENEEGLSIVDTFELNPDFEDSLFEGLPRTYSVIETALFIYTKLCEILVYDDEYYASAKNSDIRKMHENITGLCEVSKDNNKVINYEFILIFAKMLKIIGIRYTLSNNFGSDSGIQLKFRYKEYLVSVDGIEVIVQNDLARAKYMENLTGMRSLNESKMTVKKFDEMFKKVQYEYQYSILEQAQFNEMLAEYSMDYTDSNTMTQEEKIEYIVSLLNGKKLHNIEALEYLYYLYNKVLYNEFQLNFISVQGPKYETIALFTYESDGEYKYIKINLGNPSSASEITKDELKQKFLTGEYAYTDHQEKIHGLDLAGGVNYVRKPKK